MTAQTQSAPVRHWNADAGATTPRLTGKARTVDPIMHDRLARREQRRASRQNRYDTARRVARLEVEVEGLGAQVMLDSIILGTTRAHLAPEPGVIDAKTRCSDEETLLAIAEREWPHHEYLDITAEGDAA